MPVFPQPYANLSTVNIAGDPFYLVRYDSTLVSRLPTGTGLLSFPDYLDTHTPVIAQKPEEDLFCDLWHIREYYFSKNKDERRKRRLIDAVLQANPSLSGTEDALLSGPEFSQLGWQRAQNFSFDSEQLGWSETNDASRWLGAELRPDQEVPLGQRGRFINSFLPPEGDGATGRLKSPEFELKGDFMTFMIGGGKSLKSLYLALLVDGQPVRVATGCNSEWMGQRIWNISAYRGKHATLVIVDDSSDGWGHLLVDEIVEWQVRH
jgi:hypothetical protein